MRFSVVFAGVAALAGSAAATAIDTKSKADVAADVDAKVAAGADVAADVDAKAGVGADVDAQVGADVGVGADVDADVKATVDAQVQAAADAGVNVDAEINAGVAAGAGAGVGAHVGADVQAGVNVDVAVNVAAKTFKCPKSMSYCPWAKSCSCAPGQKWDVKASVCVGDIIVGAWPEPEIDVFASVDVKLAKYCAASPTKICKYDTKHEYCQAGLDTIAFVAGVEIEAEVELLGHGEIDVEADISADLKAVVAGLRGLYVETAVDAALLFNTDIFGLATVAADIDAALHVGIMTKITALTCKLGLGTCKRDCVSFCEKGCANHIDVGAEVGAQITGIVGLCILPSVILCVNTAKVIVSVAVEHLLCMVGNIVKFVIHTFDCHCS